MDSTSPNPLTFRRLVKAWLDCAMAYPGLRQSARNVAWAIADYLRKPGQLHCWPRAETIGQRIGLKARTVRAALAELIAAQLVARTRRRGRSSILRIVGVEPVEVVEPVFLVEDEAAPSDPERHAEASPEGCASVAPDDPERRRGAAENGAVAPIEAKNLNQTEPESLAAAQARRRHEAGLCDHVREAAKVSRHREGWRDSTILRWLATWRQQGFATDDVLGLISARAAGREPDHFKSIAYFERAMPEVARAASLQRRYEQGAK